MKKEKEKGITLEKVMTEQGAIYVNAMTRKKVRTIRVTGKFENKLPNYVYGTFRKPAPTAMERHGW